MADSSDKTASTNTTTGSGQSLVEDVLRETQALLGEIDTAESGSAPSDREADAASSMDLKSLVDRVDGLLGDLGHLAEAVESTDSSASKGLDLTLVLPPRTKAAEHVVPNLGSAGPQVDLFAAPEPESDPTEVESKPAPAGNVVLETEASASMSQPDPSAAGDTVLDDLAAALAREFDQPELVAADAAGGSSSSQPLKPAATRAGFAASPISETEFALMTAMTEEFGVEPTELPPVEDHGDPFQSLPKTRSEPSEAAKRLESLLAERLAEEYDLVESTSTSAPAVIEPETAPAEGVSETPTTVASTADATELVQSDIDAVARAEMEALEALGSDLGSDVHDGATPDPVTPGSSSPDSFSPDSVTPDPRGDDLTTAEADAESSGAAEVDTTAVTDVSEPTSPCGTDADSIVDHETQGRRRPSALVRLGACPFRVLPARFHRHATPVALSLAAWVPLAWGYAILAPKPAPARIDALPAGLHEAAADSPEVHDAPAHRHDVDESLAADASASNDDPH